MTNIDIPNEDITNEELVLLREIVAATNDPAKGFMFAEQNKFKFMENEGLVESNSGMEQDGMIAVRATAEGVHFLKQYDGVNEVYEEEKNLTPSQNAIYDKFLKQYDGVNEEDTPVEKSSTIKTKKAMKPEIRIMDVAAPPTVARAPRNSKYPFDSLNAEAPGNAFFVPADESNPTPWKSIQSSLTNANKRYAVPTGEMRVNRKGNTVPETKQERKFVARHVYEPEEGVLVVRVL